MENFCFDTAKIYGHSTHFSGYTFLLLSETNPSKDNINKDFFRRK
ncbi:MAG: hypothetical protein NTW78_01695 [Campylobacterales bacterium]|nr:hypothetical protein [Campylobacterales bacterium]